MNSMSSSTKLLAVFLCGAALAGCKAVETIDPTPVFPNPATTVAINGEVSGLGTARPVVLRVVTTTPSNTGTSTPGGVTTDRDVSVRGTNVLRFGAVPIGSSYAITVKTQPFARNCTIANGTGTANAEVSNVIVTCVPTDIPRFTLSVSIAGALAANPPAGFAVKLVTEEGTEIINPTAGQTLVTFTLPIFYPAANPPAFAYTVTASNTAGGTVNNCAVTLGTGSLGAGSGNITAPPVTVPPTPAVNPTVTGCLYTVSAATTYSLTPACPSVAPVSPPFPAPPIVTQPGTLCSPAITAQTVAPAVGAGLQLGLKSQITGADVLATPLTVSAFSTTAVPLSSASYPSNTSALYQVYVKNQPAGQFCIVVGGGMVNLVTSLANVTAQVRCRDVPATANQLKGVYQLDPPEVNTSNGAAVPAPRSPRRLFLTFFPNGSFIYGTHPSTALAGVEHGFYNYNPVNGTLQFTVHTDTNGVTANNFDHGLSGRPGYGTFTPGAVTAQNVVKTAGALGVPGKLSMRFGQFAAAPVAPVTFPATNYVPTLNFTEPRQTLGQIQGTWATEDSTRVFVYDDITFYGFHAGVNGAPNLQDRCLNIEFPAVATGFYVNRPGPNFFGTPTCMLSTGDAVADATAGRVTVGAVDVPNATTTNSTQPLIPGFAGRLPGTRDIVTAGSPTNYAVTPGTPDTLTIQETLNTNPVGIPVVFERVTTY